MIIEQVGSSGFLQVFLILGKLIIRIVFSLLWMEIDQSL